MILKMDMTLIEWIHLQSLLQVNAQTFIGFIRKRVCGLSVYFTADLSAIYQFTFSGNEGIRSVHMSSFNSRWKYERICNCHCVYTEKTATVGSSSVP